MVFGAAEIDDLRANVARSHDAINFELTFLRHGDFRDHGNVAAVAEVKRDALALAFREFLRVPAGFLGDELYHTEHTVGVVVAAELLAEQLKPHFKRVAAGRVRQLVDEALHHKREHVVAGSAPRTHRDVALDYGLFGEIVAEEHRGELILL